MRGSVGPYDRRTWTRSALSVLAFAALLLGPAGSLRFWQAWLFGFVFVAGTSAMSIYFLKHDPKLVERRMQIGPTAEQEPAQKIIMAIILSGFVVLLALPGFDYRWHWSAVPPWLVLAANVGVALSFGIFFVVLKQTAMRRRRSGSRLVSRWCRPAPMRSSGILCIQARWCCSPSRRWRLDRTGPCWSWFRWSLCWHGVCSTRSAS